MIQIFVAMLGEFVPERRDSYSYGAIRLHITSTSRTTYSSYSGCTRNYLFAKILIKGQSINQSILRLFEKKPLLTQTQEGCTIELRNRKLVLKVLKRVLKRQSINCITCAPPSRAKEESVG